MLNSPSFDFREWLSEKKAERALAPRMTSLVGVSWSKTALAVVRVPHCLEDGLVLRADNQFTIEIIEQDHAASYVPIWSILQRFEPWRHTFVLGGGVDDSQFGQSAADAFEEQFGEPVPLLDRELIENWVAKQSPRIYILASDRVHERNLTALYGAAETALYARAHARGPDGEAFYKEASNG